MRRSVGTGFLLSVLAALILTVGLAACSGDGDDEAATTTSTSRVETPAEKACSLLTVADATALFGRPAQPRTDDRPPSVASQCIYEATGLNGQLVQFRIFDDASYYSEKLVANATAIKGLGTKAYVNPNGPGGIVDVQFVRDGRVYALAYSNALSDAATKATQVEALARTVDGRL